MTQQTFEDKITETQKRIQDMVSYMILKIKECDWHAVADTAMDVRELEERIKTLLEVKSGR